MKLSEREWTVLNALWETDGAELGVLVTKLYENTGWSRNTVLTYLTRMEAKGLVWIDKETYPHIYHATLAAGTAKLPSPRLQRFRRRTYCGISKRGTYFSGRKRTPAQDPRRYGGVSMFDTETIYPCNWLSALL